MSLELGPLSSVFPNFVRVMLPQIYSALNHISQSDYSGVTERWVGRKGRMAGRHYEEWQNYLI